MTMAVGAAAHSSVAGISGRGYAEMPGRRASRTMSTRPFAPSLARMCEMWVCAVRAHCGGPAVRCRLLVVRCPDGLTQVTEIVSPGWNRASMLVKSSGEPTACPFTAVMTAPPVMPADAAGLPQIVP